MKYIIGILVPMIAWTLCAANPWPEVPGIEQMIIPHVDIVKAPNFKCGTSVGPVCADDCKTLMACVGKDDPLEKWDCSNYSSSSTPYCVNHMCTKEPDPKNTQCFDSATFQCTSQGVFPDPSDCTIYYVCEGVNADAKMFRCQNDYVFNTETKLCRRKTNSNQCQKVNCNGKKNKFIPFEANKGYYALCGDIIVMFKCADEENYIFDPNVNTCVYNCKSEGNFVDRFDCTKYTICERNGYTYKTFSQSCPPDYYFDKTKCIRGTCIPEITTAAPTTTTTEPPTT